jgi:hypothetical protein
MYKHGRLEWILVSGVILVFLALSAVPLLSLPLHVPLNYNEGWNAYFSQAAMHHGVLYPPLNSMANNNYPPLSFYIVGVVGWLTGDNIVGGRLVAVLSMCLVARNVLEFCRWLGADVRLACLGMGIFLLGVYEVMPDYIGIDDPHFLAYALVTSGALIFLKAEDAICWKSILLSAVLITAAGLVKHSVISLPMALCVWAIFYNRARLSVFLFFLFIVGLIAGALVYFAWGRPMIDSVLLGARLTSVKRAAVLTLQDWPFIVPYALMTVIGGTGVRVRSRVFFVLLYLVCSIANGFWMLSGYGVNQNVMCDAVIAGALGAVAFAIAVSESMRHMGGERHPARWLVILLTVLPAVVASLYSYVTTPYLRFASSVRDQHEWRQLYRTLSLSHGEVACETLAVCYWAGKPLEVDFFNYGQKLLTGRVYANAPSGFLDKVVRKSYAYVVIENDFLASRRFPPFLEDALFANYQPVQLVANKEWLMVPRR